MKKENLITNPEIPALYVHIPFCRSVCPFCSFAVMKDNPDRHHPYLQWLTTEQKLVLDEYPLKFSKIDSVYLGGGTPSLLGIFELETLVEYLNTNFNFPKEFEFTIEVNPDDITESYVSSLVELGFNRVSIGIQSFNDDHLISLKRQHNSLQGHRALNLLKKAGLTNINLDLMFGYPGQTLNSLEEDARTALQYDLQHISIYSLTLEPKTRFYRNPQIKKWIEENEDLISNMYFRVIDLLAEKGFHQYEVSNFCLPGFESKQNLAYWERRNYLGLGVGAHSHCFPYRWSNVRRLKEYKAGLIQQNSVIENSEFIDSTKKRDESLMLGLRTIHGIDIKRFSEEHQIVLGGQWVKNVSLLKEKGFLTDSETQIQLTPKGMLIADEISVMLAAHTCD